MTASKPLMLALGRALREAREAKGLSQEELALRTGVHRVYIGGIERGKRNPTVAAIAKLADEIGTPVDEILHRAQQLV